jgi:hypothetical protein
VKEVSEKPVNAESLKYSLITFSSQLVSSDKKLKQEQSSDVQKSKTQASEGKTLLLDVQEEFSRVAFLLKLQKAHPDKLQLEDLEFYISTLIAIQTDEKEGDDP